MFLIQEIRCDENIIIKPPAKFKIYNQSDLSATTLTIWEYPLDLRKEALAKFEGSVESPFIKPNQSKELYIDCAIDRFFFEFIVEGEVVVILQNLTPRHAIEIESYTLNFNKDLIYY